MVHKEAQAEVGAHFEVFFISVLVGQDLLVLHRVSVEESLSVKYEVKLESFSLHVLRQVPDQCCDAHAAFFHVINYDLSKILCTILLNRI